MEGKYYFQVIMCYTKNPSYIFASRKEKKIPEIMPFFGHFFCKVYLSNILQKFKSIFSSSKDLDRFFTEISFELRLNRMNWSIDLISLSRVLCIVYCTLFWWMTTTCVGLICTVDVLSYTILKS